MSDLLVADFSNARVGDKVKNNRGARGSISYIKTTSLNKHPLRVIFNGDINETCLTIDGKYSEGCIYPSVFYDYKGQFPTIEACKRPLPDIEVDTKMLCYCTSFNRWYNFHFSNFTYEGLLGCFIKGKTSWSKDTDEKSYFKYWKLADDPTINSGNLEEIEG